MKKTLTLMLVLGLTLGLTACNKNTKADAAADFQAAADSDYDTIVAEEDEVRFQQSAAFLAMGWRSGDLDLVCRELGSALAADETRHVAMELVHRAVACLGVEVVDVLRDHAHQPSFLLPFGQHLVTGIRFHLAVVEVVVKHLADDVPRLLRVPVVILNVERVGIIFVPNATFAPERRTATLGRHAGPCEPHNVFGSR